MKRINWLKRSILILFFGLLNSGVIAADKPDQTWDFKKIPPVALFTFYQDLHQRALQTREKLLKVSEGVALVFRGGEVVIPPLKDFERARQKVNVKYKGDWKKITDLVRGSISFQTIDDLIQGMKLFATKMPLVWVENRFEASGYQDILALFKDPDNGVIGEIQFHLCHIIKVKDEEHKLYEMRQEIERAALEERRKLTGAEQKAVEELRKASKIIYLKASEKMTVGEPCSILKEVPAGPVVEPKPALRSRL